ncbi:hypothetical protein BG006_006820 [Podila minutissima]|uniref:G domain-containing protein n=1 Tax=Podila minutissima TaxID=64525 RepID=A0A9P5VLC3_9FUNG|nr:hypothetical protein BG006_006820 [Podila minutissima]
MATATSPAEYNILFLGETQSGKSTSIESLQRYADPTHTINKENLGDGIFSKTSAVSTFNIHTNFPSSYELALEESPDAPLSFKLIDTPGLNDTSLNDEANIAIIFKALETIKSIHLVVITVSNNPFTEGLKDALKAYVNLLPELNGNIVFLHTRIDYARMHPEDNLFPHQMAEKFKILHEMMGRSNVPHVMIDNDIDSQRTIRNCITQNTLRSLLDLAKLNQPIRVHVMVMNKTQKMLFVDDVLKQKYTKLIKAREETLGGKNKEEQEILAELGDLKAKIALHEQFLQDHKRDLAFYDKDTLVFLHEEAYQQNVTFQGFLEKAKTIGQRKERGVWAVRFRRRKHQNGLFVVKIYITKRKKYSKKIED